jgi:DNA-3-methyladenine glycosylase II
MWFEPPPRDPDWSDALKHLRRDPVMKKLVARVGPCTLHPRRDYFVVLCKSIFTQQISTKVATVLFGRFRDQFPLRRPTPARVVAFLRGGDEQLIRACGLSRQKRAYVLDLAEHFVAGKIPTRRFPRMSDEEIVQSLIPVNGVGRWTAEMFLIFVLNRPDVLPVDDLGLQEGVREVLGLAGRPKPKEISPLTEHWRPYRSIATWYLWRRGAGVGKENPKDETRITKE